jgi:hypothetical protein
MLIPELHFFLWTLRIVSQICFPSGSVGTSNLSRAVVVCSWQYRWNIDWLPSCIHSETNYSVADCNAARSENKRKGMQTFFKTGNIKCSEIMRVAIIFWFIYDVKSVLTQVRLYLQSDGRALSVWFSVYLLYRVPTIKWPSMDTPALFYRNTVVTRHKTKGWEQVVLALMFRIREILGAGLAQAV